MVGVGSGQSSVGWLVTVFERCTRIELTRVVVIDHWLPRDPPCSRSGGLKHSCLAV